MDYLASLTTLPHVSFLNRFAPKGEWTHFRRRNGEFILYYLTGGAMHLREEAEDFALGPGDVLLLHPGLVHEGTKPACCDYYFVHFSNLALLPVPPGEPPAAGYPEEGEAKFDMQRCLLPKLAHIESPEARARLAGYFEEAIAARGASPNYRTLWACKLLEILVALSQNSAQEALAGRGGQLPLRTLRRLEELTAYLNRHYGEKITGKQLESMLGMNFDYLNRIFHRLNGRSIFQYLAWVRINRAKELLATTDMKLWEIAEETGFSDQFYFSRQFKKHTGMPPAFYAKGHVR